MKQKRAIRLSDSNEILEWPNGDLELMVLYELLGEAHERKLEDSRKVIITKHQRSAAFIPDGTGEDHYWENKESRLTVSELKEYFYNLQGYEFYYEDYLDTQKYYSQPVSFRTHRLSRA